MQYQGVAQSSAWGQRALVAQNQATDGLNPTAEAVPAEWWGLWVDLRCLRAAVDRGGGVSIAGRVELGHGALGQVAAFGITAILLQAG